MEITTINEAIFPFLMPEVIELSSYDDEDDYDDDYDDEDDFDDDYDDDDFDDYDDDLSDDEFYHEKSLDELDYICSNWILPLNGMVIALFVGWIWGVGKCSQELCNMHGHMPLSADATSGVRSKLNMPLSVKAWSIFIRFIAPLLTLLTFLAAIGVIKL